MLQRPVLRITAGIEALERECAQLIEAQVTGASGSPDEFRISPTKRVRMERVGRFQRVDAGSRLQVAMDTKSRLQLAVVKALSWDSGDVVSFELKDFVE